MLAAGSIVQEVSTGARGIIIDVSRGQFSVTGDDGLSKYAWYQSEELKLLANPSKESYHLLGILSESIIDYFPWNAEQIKQEVVDWEEEIDEADLAIFDQACVLWSKLRNPLQVRRVQDCYRDVNTFAEAYFAVYNGLSKAARLTGFQSYSPVCAVDIEEVPFWIWGENQLMTEAFKLEMNDQIVYHDPAQPEPSWLKGEEKPEKEVEL